MTATKRVHSRRWGHLINANFDVLFVLSPGISQCAWHNQRLADSILATRIVGIELVRTALHLSVLFTSGYYPVSLLSSQSFFILSNPFHVFQFKMFKFQMFQMFHPSHKILKSSQVCNSVALITTEALTPRNRPPPL